MAKLLFIDTAGSQSICGLADDNGLEFLDVYSGENAQSSVLNEQIKKVLNTHNTSIQDIDGVVVNEGPGSYTGLRIGLGTAKGLVYSNDIPLIFVNKFELIHALYPTDNTQFILLNARLEEWFFSSFQKDIIIEKPKHLLLDDLNNFDKFIPFDIVTDDVSLIEKWSHYPIQIIEKSFIPNIHIWNNLAQSKFEQKKFEDIAYCTPLYIKAPYTTTAKKNKI